MYHSYRGPDFERHELGSRDRSIAFLIIVGVLAIVFVVAFVLFR